MSLWSTLEQQRATFNEVLAALTAQKNSDERFGRQDHRLDNLIAAVRGISTMLESLKDGTNVDSDTVVRTHKQLMREIRSYNNYMRGKRTTQAESNAALRLMEVAEQYTAQTLKPLRKSVNTLDDDTDGFSSVDTDDLKEWYGRRLTMFAKDEDDTDSLSIKSTVGRVLWVGESISLAERVNQYTQNLQNSQPHMRYEAAVHRMEEDTPENQIRYARLLANRELQLTEKVNRVYQTLVERYGNGEDGVRKALEALVNDESYRAAKSYSALKERLMQGPMGTPIRLASEKIVMPTIRRDLDVMNLVNGTLEDTLTQNYGQSGREAVQHAREKDIEAFQAAGLPINDFSKELFALATRFAADKDHSASPFYAIASQISKLEKMNQENMTDPTYQKQLRSCYFTACSYLEKHPNPYSAKGRSRREIAQEVANLLDERLQSLQPNPNEIERDNHEFEFGQGEDNLINDEDEEIANARRARLLGHVGTAQITTMLPRERNEVASFRTNKEAREELHKFYSLIVALEQVTTGLVSNIIGAIMWLYQKLKGKSAAERDAVSYDSEHVPFMREEKYREPEGDGIITDSRRIPLAWEKHTAEDPNLPMTLTFEVDQPYEGSNVGMGWHPENVGHAFLTLKYSKMNPATGKLERYKTSFGFYPQYAGLVMSYTGASIGASVPGKIKADFGHAVSVGATVNITPQQFNDIIRFTGSYEKGGYNMATRNCTDFALEAVRHAGIVIPELENVKKVDVTNKGGLYEWPVLGIADAVFGNVLKREVAKNQVREHLETKNTTQYSRIGQAEATKEDIERLSHANLNTRLKGHAPGATAEAIRGSFSFCLHSKKYLGTEKTRKTAYEKFTSSMSEQKKAQLNERGFSAEAISSDKKKIENLGTGEKSRFLLNLMEAEAPLMRRKIEIVYAPVSRELNEVLNKMDTYHMEIRNAIRDLIRYSLDEKRIVDAEQREAAMDYMRESVKSIDSYIANLNNIFQNVFKSDTRMNIPFQNMVSLSEQLRDEIDLAYDTACDMNLIDLSDKKENQKEKTRSELQKLEQQIYDQRRDASHAIWNANHEIFTCRIPKKDGDYNEYNLRPAVVLATMLSFDDPLDALQRFCYEPGKKQTERMRSMMSTTTNALKTLQDGHEYSDPELNAVFNRLPQFESSLNADGLSYCYQTMALTAILGEGFLGNTNEQFMAKVRENRNQIECPISPDELKSRKRKYEESKRKYEAMSPEEIQALTGEDELAYLQYREEGSQLNRLPALDEVQTKSNNMRNLVLEFSTSVRNLLNEKLNALPQEKLAKLNHLAGIMAKGLIKERSATTEADKNACRRDAWTNLGTSITQGYLHSICEKAINQAKADNKLNPVIGDALKQWEVHLAMNPWTPDLFNLERDFAPVPRQSIRQAGPAQQNVAANRPEQQNALVQGH